MDTQLILDIVTLCAYVLLGIGTGIAAYQTRKSAKGSSSLLTDLKAIREKISPTPKPKYYVVIDGKKYEVSSENIYCEVENEKTDAQG